MLSNYNQPPQQTQTLKNLENNSQQIAYAFAWDVFIKPVYTMITSWYTTLKTK